MKSTETCRIKAKHLKLLTVMYYFSAIKNGHLTPKYLKLFDLLKATYENGMDSPLQIYYI